MRANKSSRSLYREQSFMNIIKIMTIIFKINVCYSKAIDAIKTPSEAHVSLGHSWRVSEHLYSEPLKVSSVFPGSWSNHAFTLPIMKFKILFWNTLCLFLFSIYYARHLLCHLIWGLVSTDSEIFQFGFASRTYRCQSYERLCSLSVVYCKGALLASCTESTFLVWVWRRSSSEFTEIFTRKRMKNTTIEYPPPEVQAAFTVCKNEFIFSIYTSSLTDGFSHKVSFLLMTPK